VLEYIFCNLYAYINTCALVSIPTCQCALQYPLSTAVLRFTLSRDMADRIFFFAPMPINPKPPYQGSDG